MRIERVTGTAYMPGDGAEIRKGVLESKQLSGIAAVDSVTEAEVVIVDASQCSVLHRGDDQWKSLTQHHRGALLVAFRDADCYKVFPVDAEACRHTEHSGRSFYLSDSDFWSLQWWHDYSSVQKLEEDVVSKALRGSYIAWKHS